MLEIELWVFEEEVGVVFGAVLIGASEGWEEEDPSYCLAPLNKTGPVQPLSLCTMGWPIFLMRLLSFQYC